MRHLYLYALQFELEAYAKFRWYCKSVGWTKYCYGFLFLNSKVIFCWLQVFHIKLVKKLINLSTEDAFFKIN